MKILQKLIFWLTVSRRCAWHGNQPGQIMHRAWFHRAYTDGICRDCRQKLFPIDTK
jgi:hypothetical protein